MPYIEETVITGKIIEISKRYSSRYQKKGITRSCNIEKTQEAQKKVNERNAETRLRWLINTNFGYQDIHLVLTYKRENRPETPEDAKTDLEKFLRKLRNHYKKLGKELKYIAVTEYKNGAIHHHLIINSIDTRCLTELWQHGQPRPTYLDNSGQYSNLASYLIKETRKTFDSPEGTHKKRWCASKNLKQPEIIKKIIPVNSWRKEPKAKKGYVLEINSIRSGIHELTGYPYQFYSMVKICIKDNTNYG